jgi:hypothetical protein
MTLAPLVESLVLAQHSRMPETVLEWALWLAVVGVCLWILWKCVQWTISPGEREPDHVKRSILDDAPAPPPAPRDLVRRS